MPNRIFYFTGTGNSLAIARAIGEGIGGAEILPVAKYLEGFAGSNEERIGLVMPVYGSGPPRMVADFVGELKPLADQYVFAVADCGGSEGKTLERVDRALRRNGSKLDAGFAVRGDFLPNLPGMGDMPIIKLIGWLGRKHVPAAAKHRLGDIIDIVSAKRTHRPEASNFAVNLVTTLIHAGAMRTFRVADKDFAATDVCTSCGICARICPRKNVRLEAGRPTWHGDCELCYACFFWCPEKAITAGGVRPTEPTHHPDVALHDMLLR